MSESVDIPTSQYTLRLKRETEKAKAEKDYWTTVSMNQLMKQDAMANGAKDPFNGQGLAPAVVNFNSKPSPGPEGLADQMMHDYIQAVRVKNLENLLGTKKETPTAQTMDPNKGIDSLTDIINYGQRAGKTNEEIED